VGRVASPRGAERLERGRWGLSAGQTQGHTAKHPGEGGRKQATPLAAPSPPMLLPSAPAYLATRPAPGRRGGGDWVSPRRHPTAHDPPSASRSLCAPALRSPHHLGACWTSSRSTTASGARPGSWTVLRHLAHVALRAGLHPGSSPPPLGSRSSKSDRRLAQAELLLRLRAQLVDRQVRPLELLLRGEADSDGRLKDAVDQGGAGQGDGDRRARANALRHQ